MIPGAVNPLLLASAQAGAAYNIERSVRFNAPDSAYLSRTPSVAGNRKTWTWAGWVKRVIIGQAYEYLLDAGVADNFGFTANSAYVYFGSGALAFKTSSAVFRDPGAWLHYLISFDSTNATAEDRCQIWINGVRLTAWSSNPTIPLNFEGNINSTSTHTMCHALGYTFMSAYLADIHFIDGQALDPTSFGEFDANGVWQPKAYTGTYPGNSFHLPFSDNSTAAALGTDTSGNGNDWTVNNISVTAGSGNDSLVNTPTNYGTDTGVGGEVRGNYATLNPLNSTAALTNGNLDCSGSNVGAVATFVLSGTDFYWETIPTAIGIGGHIGVLDAARINASTLVTGGATDGLLYRSDGVILRNTGGGWTNNQTGLATYTAIDVIGITFSNSTNAMQFYKNGASVGTAVTMTTGINYVPWAFLYGTAACTFNFGQRPFAYTAPSGYKALCTTNLPEPQTITTSGSYTGNGVADGPFVYLNGVPTAMTVNGTAVTFGTHADKLSNGFKLRTTSTTYNQNAATYNYSVTSTGSTFKTARAQAN